MPELLGNDDHHEHGADYVFDGNVDFDIHQHDGDVYDGRCDDDDDALRGDKRRLHA
jgi:cupin superfamily acireductone dioxygenase involved in methionine salvage